MCTEVNKLVGEGGVIVTDLRWDFIVWRQGVALRAIFELVLALSSVFLPWLQCLYIGETLAGLSIEVGMIEIPQYNKLRSGWAVCCSLMALCSSFKKSLASAVGFILS